VKAKGTPRSSRNTGTLDPKTKRDIWGLPIARFSQRRVSPLPRMGFDLDRS
jgi:hypothetical protein